MRNLIYHDLKVLQNFLICSVIGSLVAGLFVFHPEASEYFYGFVLTAFAIHILHSKLEKTKIENIPKTPKTVIRSRYVTAFIIALINTLLPLCILMIQHLLEPSRSFPDFDYAIFTFVTNLFYLFLYLPFYFRFGHGISKGISIFIFFIAFILNTIGTEMIFGGFSLKKLAAQEQLLFIMGSVIFITIIGFFSLFYSIRMYSKL